MRFLPRWGFILNLLAIRAIGIKKFHTYELKNQYDISIEWENYRRQVTDYENRRYLPVL